MDGKILRSRILKLEPSIGEVAKKLNVLPQSLNQTLKAADIKTGFIESLVEAFDKPVTYFFGIDMYDRITIEDNSKHDDHSATFGSKTEHYENSDLENLAAKLKLAEQKIEALKSQISSKDETIAALKSDVESKQKLIDLLMNK